MVFKQSLAQSLSLLNEPDNLLCELFFSKSGPVMPISVPKGRGVSVSFLEQCRSKKVANENEKNTS